MLLAGTIFSLGLTGFLGVCALFVCREPDACDDELSDMLGLGGGSLAEEYRRHTTGARPTDPEITVFHSTQIIDGRREDHAA